MKHYAEFYRKVGSRWVEATGDRSVLRLDGRLSFENMCNAADEWAVKHKYDGYRIGRGQSLLRLFYLTSTVYGVRNAKE